MKLRKLSFFIFFTLITLNFGCNTKKVAPPEPYGAIPSPQQVDWQQMEYYMFIHFGPNTFTGKEWGSGAEDPDVFNPSQLNAEQWAATAKAAGMKGIIITAKHHDGFALWPSKYSDHTVRQSPWKDGKGDVLKLLSEACEKYGLKFGVYLSPWDMNHPVYGTPEYNQVFANMLDEVFTNYGPIFEMWFDGAKGEGEKQVYDWNLFHKTVYEHNPEAIIFSDVGPGTRWIGNEHGFAGPTNWSTLNTEGFEPGIGAPPRKSLNQGDMGGAQWVPGEADVSIRPGWFYDPATNDDIKTVNELLEIYYASVGRNANLLLNVPVSRKGLIHPNDSTRLMEFKKVLDKTFDDNIALDKEVEASNVRGNVERYNVQNLLDENYETYWATDDSIKKASFTVDLGQITEFNRLVLKEYIPLGQRVKSFSVEIWDGGKFKKIDEQTTIGYKRILVLPMVKTSKVRVNIEALASPVISEFQLYKAPEILSDPIIKRNKQGMINIITESPDPIITYTIDGAEPTLDSKKFTAPFPFESGGTIKAKAFINDGEQASETILATFDVAPIKWTVVSTDSEVEGFEASKAIDSDPTTAWRTNPEEGSYPHEIVIDLGEKLNLNGFTYTPHQSENTGTIYKYNFYISEDGTSWQKIIDEGTFGNIKNNPIKQEVKFDEIYNARYIKLQGLSSIHGDEQMASVGEIGVLTEGKDSSPESSGSE